VIPAICRAWLFALPGSELEEGPPGGSQGGASPGRAVPASGLHRYQLEFAESVGGTVYKKRGTAEQWIKEGKQAAREGKLSRRRNNRSGVQALGRESQNGNSGKDLRSTALYSVCPNFVAAFWLAVVEDWEVLMVDLRTSFPALGVSARAFFWLCFLCAGAVCTAQTGTSLRGTITDPSGALVPNATVILENVGTNASRTVTTNSEGVYQILQVAPGPYRLTAELAGFKPILTENIQLLINTPANLDLKFELLGQVTNVQVLFI